jgi:hypothetical protein
LLISPAGVPYGSSLLRFLCCLEQIPTHSAGTKFAVKLVALLFIFGRTKLRTRKLDQSSKNLHSPQISVRELNLHPQRHQFHNKSRGHAQTRITLTCSTTRGLSQRHHLARAALGHSTAQVVVLNKSRRGDGRGDDLWIRYDRSFITCVVVVLVRRAFVCIHACSHSHFLSHSSSSCLSS